MKKIETLKTEEINLVSGGDIIEELMRRFPWGVWDGGTFYPHGRKSMPSTTPVLY